MSFGVPADMPLSVCTTMTPFAPLTAGCPAGCSSAPALQRVVARSLDNTGGLALASEGDGGLGGQATIFAIDGKPSSPGYFYAQRVLFSWCNARWGKDAKQ
jgi:hypothetical protein